VLCLYCPLRKLTDQSLPPHLPPLPPRQGGFRKGGYRKHVKATFPEDHALRGREHVPSDCPLLIAKQLESRIVGRDWQPGDLNVCRRGWVLTERQAAFVRSVRAILGNPPPDAMLVEWEDKRTGKTIKRVVEAPWAGQHLAKVLELSYVALELAERVNAFCLPPGYAAGRLPTFDLVPKAYIKRYHINMDTEVRLHPRRPESAFVRVSASLNQSLINQSLSFAAPVAQLTACMVQKAKTHNKRPRLPKKFTCKPPGSSGWTVAQQDNLFARVFDLPKLHHRRKGGGHERSLAFASVHTDGVVAAAHLGKPGAKRTKRGAGTRGRGGGGGEGGKWRWGAGAAWLQEAAWTGLTRGEQRSAGRGRPDISRNPPH